MPDAECCPSILEFDSFCLDLRSFELRKHGMHIRLPRQPTQVLTILARRAGKMVTREELQLEIWGTETFVDFERGLNNCIKQIRQALNDDAENPRYVETIPRVGYRFIATVNGSGEATAAAQGPVMAAPSAVGEAQPWHQRNALRILAAAGFVGLLLGAGTGRISEWFSRGAASPSIRSLAVLPLQNLSPDADQEYFSDGMTDALITDLAQIGSLKVISRTSSMQFKQTKKTLPEVAKELNVDGVVEGTVQRSGDRVRINVQLIHGPTDKHLWARSYQGEVRDLFELESTIAKEIAGQIQARVAATGMTERSPIRPIEPKVLDAYLQGNYHLNRQGRGFGDEEKRKAAEYFEAAVSGDPEFALAYHDLAMAHENLLLGSSEDLARAAAAAERAAQLDPKYSLTLLGLKWIPNLDMQGAEQGYEELVSRDPNNAWPHSALCSLLITRGRAEEGMRQCRIAQRLDPMDDDAALGLYFGRDYDGSIATFKRLLQQDPDVGVWHLDLIPDYAMKGMGKETIEEMEKFLSLYGQPAAAKYVGAAYSRDGYREAVRQWIKEVEQMQERQEAYLPGYLAGVYLVLGEKDRAMYWLEQAYEHREKTSLDEGIFFMGAEPMYDPLRDDPRFKKLLERVNGFAKSGHG